MKKRNIKDPWGMADFMVVAGFRYCLGRASYAPAICVEWIKDNWKHFDGHTKALIVKEIKAGGPGRYADINDGWDSVLQMAEQEHASRP